jgi:hypothetical protein
MCYPSAHSIVYGEVSHGAQKADVQVIVVDDDMLLWCDIVFRFHLTCVQSFRDAHVACQFYGGAASSKLTYEWISALKPKEPKSPCQKYVNNDYSVVSRPKHPRGYLIRSADDEEFTVLIGYNYVSAPQCVVDFYLG